MIKRFECLRIHMCTWYTAKHVRDDDEPIRSLSGSINAMSRARRGGEPAEERASCQRGSVVDRRQCQCRLRSIIDHRRGSGYTYTLVHFIAVYTSS